MVPRNSFFSLSYTPGIPTDLKHLCYKDLPGLGNRSILYLHTRNTLTSGVVGRTRAYICNTHIYIIYTPEYLVYMYIYMYIYIYVPGYTVPTPPGSRRSEGEGERCKDYPGLGNRSAFYYYFLLPSDNVQHDLQH